MYCATVYVVRPPGLLFNHLQQAACHKTTPPPNTNRRKKWNVVLMTAHTLTYTQTHAQAMTEVYTYTQRQSCTCEQRKVDRALMG